MNHTLLVVDDFYDDPDTVVAQALALPFRRVPGANFPGVAAETFQDQLALMKRVAGALGSGAAVKYRGEQGMFRITTEADMLTRTSMVHLDSSDWSGVIYLNREPTEGTSFYRHRRLDLSYVGAEANQRPEVRRAIEEDTLNPDAWELIYEIPMKYNRLLVFDGKYFHSGAKRLTGASLAEGRITQNFFFYRA
jgi:hypothetical protein